MSLKVRKLDQIFGHGRVPPRDTIWGHVRDTIRDTIFRVVSLIVSLRTGDTIFLKIVSLSFLQGHDWGTRHDRVPDKSTPAVMTTDEIVTADAMVVNQVEFSSEASSSHPGVAPGMRSMSVAGCEDATVLERRIGLDRRRKIRIATWNCGGLSYTTRDFAST